MRVTLPQKVHELSRLFLSGLSYAEIASRLGCTVDGAKNRIARSRRRYPSLFYYRRTPTRLSDESRSRLVAELPCACNLALARKYGVTRERVRQLRVESGVAPVASPLHPRCVGARLKRAARERVRVARAEYNAVMAELKLARLRLMWLSGVPRFSMASALGMSEGVLSQYIFRKRRDDPLSFPYRYAYSR